MALDNATVLENLQKQRVEVEQGLETTREMYLKLLGAIEVLEQIEEQNNPTETSETEVVEGE
jgi:hypothetical protein